MLLNDQQKLAVQHKDGPLLILAGAGSGKTRVLTERIVNLIKTGACQPYQILAVTFTNKAAGEMRERVERSIGTTAREIWLNTFHAACVKILRRHGENLGLPPHFVIFDAADQLSLLKKVLAALNISDKILSPRSAMDKISRAKDGLIEASGHPDGDFYNEKIAMTYRAYEQELRKAGAVDFGDLIMLTVKLFRTVPEALAHYQQRFRYIMVDEYQDTNHAQYELVRLLADRHKNICVVGDPDQSIYAWRGADISNILGFERDFPGAAVIKLEQNYRSTKNIIAASDAVIANNKSRKPKELWTENDGGSPINIIEALDERGEAKEVVRELKRLQGDGVSPKEAAIFYRTNAQSRLFEDELRAEGIPYVIFGGTRFYDRAEIKNAIAYLRLIGNPADNVSLKRVINVPARGIGKTTVEKLEAYATQAGIPILEFIETNLGLTDLNNGVKQRLASFANLVKSCSGRACSARSSKASFATTCVDSRQPLPILVSEVLDKTGYPAALKAEKTDESLERLANLDELVSAVSEAYRNDPKMTLADFLDQVALISDLDKNTAGQDVLPMMTLHLAKGLEFDHVFIVGLEEGLLPHIRTLDDPGELEEERRLFYVGMTRARRSLYICHANERMVRGSFSYNVPSRFLEEIPEDITEYVAQDSFAPPNGGVSPAKHVAQDSFAPPNGGVGPAKHVAQDFSPAKHVAATFRSPSINGRLKSSATKHVFDNFNQDIGDFNFAQDDHSSNQPLFKTGQRVRHPTFGEGIIRRTEGKAGEQRLLIQFKSGELKRLLASHARLSVLSS